MGERRSNGQGRVPQKSAGWCHHLQALSSAASPMARGGAEEVAQEPPFREGVVPFEIGSTLLTPPIRSQRAGRRSTAPSTQAWRSTSESAPHIKTTGAGPGRMNGMNLMLEDVRRQAPVSGQAGPLAMHALAV